MQLNKLLKDLRLFDATYYLEVYADVRKAEINPLIHYCKHGWREGRKRLPQKEYIFLRLIYQRYPILRRIKNFIWIIKDKISMKNFLPTSSVFNELALHKLTERRFCYTENYFSQLINSNNNMNFPSIDISVVTYNSAKWIDQFMHSLIAQDYPLTNINLYFVDNGSKDDTIKQLETINVSYASQFKSFQVIQQRNIGFGAGHNKAIENSRSTFFLVTNIDLIFEKSAICNAVKIALTDIDEEYASWEFRQIPYEHPKYYDPITLETNWSSHACILIRRSAYEKVGGYEPRIFMYAEDVELSYRFRAYGYHLKYCPNAVVNHFTYEEVNQVKPLQFEGSTLGNAYLRLRYGNNIDQLAIILLYFALLLRPERFKGSKKIIYKNIHKIIKNLTYFKKFKCVDSNFFAPFREFDYEMIRNGAFYEVNLPKKTPLVSIIVRTYKNREMLLKQALISIANQTYKNIEVIVVEDGGNSMSEIVNTLSDHINIKFFSLGKVERSKTGNYGLSQAVGEYCIFLDDDDLFFADHIEILVEALIKNPKASASYSLAFQATTKFLDENRKFYKEVSISTLKIFNQEFDYKVLQDHNYFPIQAILFNRNLFLERGGLDETLIYLEDWNLWLRYAHNNHFVYVPKTTSLYRVPSDNTIAKARQKLLHQAYLEAKKKAIENIKRINK